METLITLGENLSIESVTPRFVVIHHVLTTRLFWTNETIRESIPREITSMFVIIHLIRHDTKPFQIHPISQSKREIEETLKHQLMKYEIKPCNRYQVIAVCKYPKSVELICTVSTWLPKIYSTILTLRLYVSEEEIFDKKWLNTSEHMLLL